MKALEVEELTKVFRKGVGKETINALDQVSFSLQKGNVLGVVGPNGSGKTTLFKCILRLINPTHGKIIRFENKYSESVVKSKIGFLYERVSFYPEFTPLELLFFFGKMYDIPSKILKVRMDEILEIVELSNFKNVKIKNFSKGMVQRVGIAITLINDCELLIFDELISGLDPIGTLKMIGIVKKLIDRNKTLIISSHVLPHVEELCTEILILYKGKALKSAKMADLITDRKQYRIDLKISTYEEGEQAKKILENSGFCIQGAAYSNRDLENIFITVIGESS